MRVRRVEKLAMVPSESVLPGVCGDQSTARSVDPKFWQSLSVIGPVGALRVKAHEVRRIVSAAVLRGLRSAFLGAPGRAAMFASACALALAGCDGRDTSPNFL